MKEIRKGNKAIRFFGDEGFYVKYDTGKYDQEVQVLDAKTCDTDRQKNNFLKKHNFQEVK